MATIPAFGVPVAVTFMCRRGTVLNFEGGKRIALHPSDWMRLRNHGRVPLWSEWTTGAREARRDRRR